MTYCQRQAAFDSAKHVAVSIVPTDLQAIVANQKSAGLQRWQQKRLLVGNGVAAEPVAACEVWRYSYEQVFGPNHAKSETLRDQLCALDAVVANKAPVKIEERADDLQVGPSHLGIKKPPSILKRHKLFRKLGLRFRP